MLIIEYAQCQNISLNASVDKSTVGINEYFRYELEVNGIRNPGRDLKLPDFRDFNIVNSSQGTKMMITGATTVIAYTLTLVLAPQKTGDFTIPEASLNYKGKSYRSNSIKIKVITGTQKPAQQATRPSGPQSQSQNYDRGVSGNVFYKVSTNKTTAYVYEPVVLSYSFYYRIGVSGVRITEMPELDDFTVTKLPDTQTRQTVIDGRTYYVDELKYLITPIATGKYNIDKSVVTFSSGGFFGKTYELESKPITLTIIDFPEAQKPDGFDGAIGSFSISAKFSANEISTNEPVNLTITIKGEGNFSNIHEINLDLPPDIDQYESTSAENISADGETIRGEKVFEYVLIPRAQGTYSIPPVSFDFFDYRAKKYKTVKTAPLSISAKGVVSKTPAASASNSISSRKTVEVINRGINHIKPVDTIQPSSMTYLYKNKFFISFHIFPLILVFSTLILKRRKQKMISDPVSARFISAKGIASKKLRKAKSLINESKSSEFYAELYNALCSYCSDKLNISSSSLITEDLIQQISEHIENDIPEESIRQCFNSCNTARFSPQTISVDEMRISYREACELINSIEKKWKRNT